MTTVRSILRDPFISMSLIAGGVALTGCVDPAPPTSSESADLAADHVTITDGDALSGLPVQTVQYEHTPQGDKLSAPGFKQTAPGEWTMSANGTTMSLKASPVASAIIQPRVSCSLNFYIGPSGFDAAGNPVFGVVGEAAIGQLDCLDGAVSTTITTQACTDLGCNVPQSVTGTASPGLPFTSGVIVPGAAGAACSGTVVWDPPGVFVSTSNPCG
jgi:hypothetical protein